VALVALGAGQVRAATSTQTSRAAVPADDPAAAPIADPASVSFRGAFMAGDGNYATVKVRNPGASQLDLNPRVTGPDAASFRYAGGSCQYPLAGGASCDAELVFVAPARPGVATATLELGVTRVPLSGSSLGPVVVPPPVPTPRVPPAVIGRPLAGRTVACGVGGWLNAPVIAVSWLRDGTPIAGATSRRYRLAAADGGHAIQCRESAGAAASLSAPRAVTRRCVVPHVKGRRLPAARRMLTRAGCRAGVVRGSGRRVRATRPKAGSSLPLRAKVRLDLS
jgi:hypothetical protein